LRTMSKNLLRHGVFLFSVPVVDGLASMHPHTVFPCRRPDLEDASDVTITPSGMKTFAISKRSTSLWQGFLRSSLVIIISHIPTVQPSLPFCTPVISLGGRGQYSSTRNYFDSLLFATYLSPRNRAEIIIRLLATAAAHRGTQSLPARTMHVRREAMGRNTLCGYRAQSS
jgi:hypothetical protein